MGQDKDNEVQPGDIVTLTSGPYAGFEVEVIELNEDGTVKECAAVMPKDPERLRQLQQIIERERAKREARVKEEEASE